MSEANKSHDCDPTLVPCPRCKEPPCNVCKGLGVVTPSEAVAYELEEIIDTSAFGDSEKP